MIEIILEDGQAANKHRMNCIFCQIVQKEMKAEIVYEDDNFLVFNDINPKANIHLLLIPKEHIESVDHLTDRHKDLMGRMFLLAKRLAREQKFALDGYKLLFNVGRGAGQAVDHLHMHILSGDFEELP